jgi:hypothetical protein
MYYQSPDGSMNPLSPNRRVPYTKENFLSGIGPRLTPTPGWDAYAGYTTQTNLLAGEHSLSVTTSVSIHYTQMPLDVVLAPVLVLDPEASAFDFGPAPALAPAFGM